MPWKFEERSDLQVIGPGGCLTDRQWHEIYVITAMGLSKKFLKAFPDNDILRVTKIVEILFKTGFMPVDRMYVLTRKDDGKVISVVLVNTPMHHKYISMICQVILITGVVNFFKLFQGLDLIEKVNKIEGEDVIAELYWICTDYNFRRQGFGRYLIQHVLKDIKLKCCNSDQDKLLVKLSVFEKNIGAVKSYTDIGFRIIARKEIKELMDLMGEEFFVSLFMELRVSDIPD